MGPAGPPVRLVTPARGPVVAEVTVPGSKSIANRALAVAALADGTSTLRGLPDGDDTVAMVDCLLGLGAVVGVSGSTATVGGAGGRLHPRAGRLHAGLAGTTSRFVTALAALADAAVVVDGDDPLRTRPMRDLHDALAALGVGVAYEGRPGHLPASITGPARGGVVRLPGDVSSQFVSALMMIGPALAGGLRIELTTPLVSVPYVELTAAVMAAFGVTGVEVGADAVVVPAGCYTGTDYAVEPDASSASYPLAVAAVAGGEVTVPGLTMLSAQGDIEVVSLLGRFGCDVVHRADGIAVRRDPTVPLAGIDADLADTSDLVPTIAAVAVTAATPTTIRGVGFIRAKESDRLGDLAAELAKTGARVAVTADGLHIEPADLHGARLAPHHDHRLAMAFAVLGAVVEGIEVEEPGVVTKSWPGFWDAYDTLLGA